MKEGNESVPSTYSSFSIEFDRIFYDNNKKMKCFENQVINLILDSNTLDFNYKKLLKKEKIKNVPLTVYRPVK